MFEPIGRFLSKILERERPRERPMAAQDFEALRQTLRIGDVLLVEGRARVSAGIRYLTQSTWSHAALCVSDRFGVDGKVELVEVTLQEGCHRIGLEKYAGFNTRICRAAALSGDERRAVAAYMCARIGTRYDLRNVFDLARYLIPTPPVPVWFRRKMLSIGSGDPTRAICSTLVAQAFQSVSYPILPQIEAVDDTAAAREIWHVRHHSLFVPRDFDLSPYFAVIKPTLVQGFDHRGIPWAEGEGEGENERDFVG